MISRLLSPGGRLLAVASMVIMTIADSTVAAVCDGVPSYQPQVMAPVRYTGWETKGWAYYCSGDHPYYWSVQNVYGPIPGPDTNYSVNSKCFSHNENYSKQWGNPSKFDATFTNWCFKSEELVVTLGCSTTPQNFE